MERRLRGKFIRKEFSDQTIRETVFHSVRVKIQHKGNINFDFAKGTIEKMV